MTTLVMVFLKAPRPGTVKTRLGRDIGHPRATAVYRALAEQQLDRIPAEFCTEIHYAPRGAREEMRRWFGRRHLFRAQNGRDLGERMNRAFAHGFIRGFGRIIAIGSDCPELDGDCLRRADAELLGTDVVLGPATDGGYYLIGLRQPQPALFKDIAWSTETVLAETMVRVRKGGLSHRLLEEKEDIDDLAGWQRHQAKNSVRAAPAAASIIPV